MHTRYRTILFCTANSFVVATQAQGLQPAPVKLGFVDFVPALAIKEEYDSNLYRQPENAQESLIQVMLLNMKALALDGPHEYSLNYRGEAGFVQNSSDDNYVDQAATLDGNWDLNARHRVQLTGGYKQDHDRRGTEYFQGESANLIDEPARFHEEFVETRYSYGAPGASGRLDFDVKGTNKRYMNFRDFTEQGDLSDIYGTATFLWRLAGTLRGLVETTYGSVNYKEDPARQDGILDVRDSDYARYLAGVTWELAGKTTGTLKVGHATKDFSDRDRKDFAGTSWSGELTWNPRSYSSFTIASGRRTDESHNRGDYIDATDWSIAWDHQWSKRLDTRVHYRQSDETYEGDPQRRDDTIKRYGFSFDYTLRRWLVVGMFYTRDQRESNLAQFDYPRDFTGLTLRASL